MISFLVLPNQVRESWLSQQTSLHNTLSCCLVEHFNISGSEFVGSCIKLTGVTRCRVPRGEGVGAATVGVGIASSIIGYPPVVSSSKRWSPIRTCVNSVTVTT